MGLRPFDLKSKLILLAFLLVAIPHAAFSQSPRTFTVDARLFNPVTPTDPLADNNLTVNIKILNPGKTCVLYEETQTIATAADGRFNMQVGSAPGSVKRAGTDPNNSMATIFQNLSAINTTNSSCASGYTPTAADLRYMRITLTPSSTGVPETLAPDTVLDSVPSAIVAESLQGLDRARVLEIGTPATLSQANVANIFSASHYPKMTALLAGSSVDYVRSSTTNGASLPSLSTAPPSPTAGQIWYDTTSSTVKYYDGTSTRVIGYSGSTITSPLSNGKFWVGNSSQAATEVTASGDVSMTNAGAFTVLRLRGTSIGTSAPSADGQVLRYASGTTSWMPAFLTMADIRSSVTVGQTILPTTACAADKTLNWSSLTDIFTCQTIALSDSQVTYAPRASNLIFASPSSGPAGAPSFRALSHADLPAGAASQWIATSGNLYYASGAVAIGTTVPVSGASLTIAGIGTGSSSLLLPRDSTTNRPTGANGMIRYNTTVNKFEVYEGGAWNSYANAASTASSGVAGAVQFSTGVGVGFNADASRLYWDNSNKYLGVGTSIPTAPLSVVDATSNASLRIQNTNPANPSSLVFRDSGGVDRGTTQWSNANNVLSLATYGTDPLVFGTNATERVRLTNDGRVGIGTNSPAAGAILELNGTTTTNSGFVLPRATTTTRPTAAVNGMLRYNVDENSFEGYANGHWSFIGAAGAAGTIDDLLDASTYGGTNSVFLGKFGGNGNSGDGNTATGFNAMTAIGGGSTNTAMGNLALTSVVVGNSNTAIGYAAGKNTTGNENTFVGHNAGVSTTSGNSNILIGSGVSATSATSNQQLNIGNLLYGDLSAKRLAIGTTSPTAMLHLYNASTVNARTILEGNGGAENIMGHQLRPLSTMNAATSFMFGATENSTGVTRAGIFVPNSSRNGLLEAVSIVESTGNVGIGKTPATAYKLDVVGDGQFTGTVRANGGTLISDRRFKKEIAPLSLSLEKILKLRGVRYRMRTDEFPERRFSDRAQIGLVAQEVEVVFPELVEDGFDGYKSVNYTALVAPLAEATKEVYGLCKSQGDRIGELEKEVSALKTENASIKAYLCAKDSSAPFCRP